MTKFEASVSKGNGFNSFSDRLRAGKDQERHKSPDRGVEPTLVEVELLTGEEDETTVLAVFGKLFKMEGDQWKERGVGTLKLNSGGVAPRLLMRNNKVHKIILNVKLFPEMCPRTRVLSLRILTMQNRDKLQIKAQLSMFFGAKLDS
ncbi:hypothetical protein R3P38DRAFT_2758847 [Favolaschia claudopus]|uniref:RanBD1 domain-containing protein n=1 Tax=Favolaschia claudopus TaxID=2862362 RepID=A0AAW0E4G0_9AGAR